MPFFEDRADKQFAAKTLQRNARNLKSLDYIHWYLVCRESSSFLFCPEPPCQKPHKVESSGGSKLLTCSLFFFSPQHAPNEHVIQRETRNRGNVRARIRGHVCKHFCLNGSGKNVSQIESVDIGYYFVDRLWMSFSLGNGQQKIPYQEKILFFGEGREAQARKIGRIVRADRKILHMEFRAGEPSLFFFRFNGARPPKQQQLRVDRGNFPYFRGNVIEFIRRHGKFHFVKAI